MRFSDRIGATAPSTLIQDNSIDDALRNGLWQSIYENYLDIDSFNYIYKDDIGAIESFIMFVLKKLHVDIFKLSSDNVVYGAKNNIESLRRYFFACEWHECFNIIEFYLGVKPPYESKADFVKRINFFLERERSAFRIIENVLCRLSDPVEVESVDAALAISDKYGGARGHIKKAVGLYSKRPEPDFANAIKEAISAVEAAVRIATNNDKGTLGQMVSKLKEEGKLHPAMSSAISQLYGYASNEQGIRHASTGASKIDEAETRFMLVTCSSIVSFIVSKFDVQ